ncbi:putative 1-acyl-sn-glycerol-3-phosphate acyltransferase 4 [Apostasia shenzhenica]|uniref:1-acylglycerol-3-phosphate O-acyltransferase n=1 Tax=Apostasia shenzhenica TaxID=1088818 RepID=A0A2I0A248_9ASPA|nr:putative 1-acyl-sn-glycerol-3-phosphate acyltransferase 4 [Apostasia shenzhenica]
MVALLLRFFSVHYSRQTVALLFGSWLSLWPFLFEKLNKTKVIFSGDRVPSMERVLLFANHRTEVDWMYLWNLALRKGCLGYIKYVLKSSLMKLPVFGWGFQILEFVPVERNWTIDEPIIRRKLSTFKDPRDPLCEQKCMRSQHYAAERSLPVLKNVLLPKTKGFYACLEALRESLDAVYDITIAYKHSCPTFLDNAFGVDPAEVHIHVRRILPHEIPDSEEDVAAWLMDRFKTKDRLLSDFTEQGFFPCEGTEEELSTFSCVAYVLVSGVYLSYVTYFDVQPTATLGCLKALFCSKKNL